MDSTTPRRITLDQVVAYNLRRARQLRDWTQNYAAERLEPYLGERWSSAVFSAAERSYEGTRVREFTASHVLAFSLGFELPLMWFYEPPADDVRVHARGSEHAISGDDLTRLLGVTAVEAMSVHEAVQHAEDLLTAARAFGNLHRAGLSQGKILGYLTSVDALQPLQDSPGHELMADPRWPEARRRITHIAEITGRGSEVQRVDLIGLVDHSEAATEWLRAERAALHDAAKLAEFDAALAEYGFPLENEEGKG